MVSPRPLTTVVVGLPRASASVTYSILDVLASVGRDWALLHGSPSGPSCFATAHLSLDGEPYREVNGRRITPEGRLDSIPAPDLVIVPDLHIDPTQPMPDLFAPIAAWARQAHAEGAILTSVCSGALLLAETGLLDGETATTHWGYADTIMQRYPKIKLRRERILVPAGEGHRLITAGGASAWADLLLYLITRFAGADEARRIAKIYLIEPHTQGQMCYASLSTGRQHDDQIVGEAQAWAAMNYAHPRPVTAMAQRSGLTERSFLRRFRRATGQSPLAYIQTLRVEEAKQMLETTAMPIDDIAAEVGYAEPTSLRSAFRRHVGMPASAYRRKWRGAVPAE